VIIPDVNIWIPALRPDLSDHQTYRDWLSAAIEADEPLGISELILSGVVRILTNPRIFQKPSGATDVLAALDTIRSAPGTQPLLPGERHWSIFADLCITTAAKANLVADAYHAALAIEHGAVFITNDRDFAAFRGLSVRPPFG
jgi:toxin-antitoxin system PIN domain toxin